MKMIQTLKRSRFGMDNDEHNDAVNKLIPEYLFVPAVVETLGPINEEGANFLCDLESRIEKITQDRLEKCHIFQRISVAVQRGNALSFAGCFPEEV